MSETSRGGYAGWTGKPETEVDPIGHNPAHHTDHEVDDGNGMKYHNASGIDFHMSPGSSLIVESAVVRPKWEYQILIWTTIEELSKTLSLLGRDGWQVCVNISAFNLLLIREILPDAVSAD